MVMIRSGRRLARIAHVGSITAMGRDLYSHRPRGPDPFQAKVSRRALFGLRMGGIAETEVDFERAGERLLALWDRGGHAPLLRAAKPAAEVVAGLARAGPADRVLELMAGDGHTRLLASGTRLPFGDRVFDVVVSAFGASQVPDPSLVAGELTRVLTPGGRLVLGAWSPRGLPGGFDGVVERVAPLPQGVPAPSAWGVQGVVRERLGSLLEGLELRARTVPIRFESPDDAFEAIAGATGLHGGGGGEARRQFDRLLASCNQSPSGVEIRARYLVTSGGVTPE
jgi:SAM-dependent methyltransferase